MHTLDAHPFNHASPIYKPWYQLYKLQEIDQPTIVATSLIPRGVDFMYLAIPNPLQQSALNGGISYKTASRPPRLH